VNIQFKSQKRFLTGLALGRTHQKKKIGTNGIQNSQHQEKQTLNALWAGIPSPKSSLGKKKTQLPRGVDKKTYKGIHKKKKESPSALCLSLPSVPRNQPPLPAQIANKKTTTSFSTKGGGTTQGSKTKKKKKGHNRVGVRGKNIRMSEKRKKKKKKVKRKKGKLEHQP